MAKFKRPKTLILGLIASMVLLVGILFIFDSPENSLRTVLALLLILLAVVALAFITATFIALIRRAIRKRSERDD